MRTVNPQSVLHWWRRVSRSLNPRPVSHRYSRLSSCQRKTVMPNPRTATTCRKVRCWTGPTRRIPPCVVVWLWTTSHLRTVFRCLTTCPAARSPVTLCLKRWVADRGKGGLSSSSPKSGCLKRPPPLQVYEYRNTKHFKFYID